MRVLVFALLALAAFGNSHAIPRADVDLVEVITNIFSFVKNDLSDKLKVTDIEIPIFEQDIGSGTLKINEISLTGLGDTDYTVGRNTIVLKEVDFAATIPDLLLVVDLEIDLTGLIDLQEIDFFGDVVVNDDFTEVTDFNVLLKIEDDVVVVKGIINDEYSERISAELTQTLQEIFNEIAGEGSAEFSEAIKTIINIILQLLT
ncbi:hypothetical protein NQ318_019840 [Aromia moschata]|uniref:Uncharacterized protein n=1 Tax=Aromia moschata TaxID=1265417 RepID=A0AAV8YL28_9CUCU|nr:hypothetical protein NQ318_019840 [Aromia moschata]